MNDVASAVGRANGSPSGRPPRRRSLACPPVIGENHGMTSTLPKAVRPSDLTGETLYGDDFDETELRAWLADEEKGFYNLVSDIDPGLAVADDHRAMNRFHGAMLADRRYPVTLMLGCADGTDLIGLGIETDRVIAIEPAREWWRDAIGGIPAEYRAPAPDGAIDLPDASVDLVVCLGVLHHVPNVGRVIGELARVLRPGGRMIVREPMVSMGDFRQPRPGLTARERGIPRALMRRFHQQAGLRILDERPCAMMVVYKGLLRLGIQPYTRPWAVRLDDFLGRLAAPFARYSRSRPWHKLAPSSLAVFSQKP
jgi:SAM-dependent methyltransferase